MGERRLRLRAIQVIENVDQQNFVFNKILSLFYLIKIVKNSSDVLFILFFYAASFIIFVHKKNIISTNYLKTSPESFNFTLFSLFLYHFQRFCNKGAFLLFQNHFEQTEWTECSIKVQ